MSSASITETGKLHQLQDEEKEEERRVAYPYEYYTSIRSNSSSSSVWEIEEEEEEEEEKSENNSRAREVNRTPLGTLQEESTMDHIIISRSNSNNNNNSNSNSSNLFSFDHVRIYNDTDINNNEKGDHRDEEEDCVYVGIGNKDDEQSSLEALSWTLNHHLINIPTANYMVCLVHVFPEIHHVPSPLGKLPKSQVSPKQMENYVAQERGKRRDFLQKFLNMCTASKVKVDTVLIESDLVGKAFLDLIPILNIRKLVLGTTKSGLRRSKTKRGGGVIGQILEKAPEYCDIKVICEGKEVKGQITNGSPSPSGVAYHVGENTTKSIPVRDRVQPPPNESFACMCFKSPRVM